MGQSRGWWVLGVLLLFLALACGGFGTKLDAPPNLAMYSNGLVELVVGTPMLPDVPMGGSKPMLGGPEPLTAAAYSIFPPLPPGLGLDGSSGVISGTPTAPSSPAGYTVTASNGSGHATAWLQITVFAKGAPYDLWFAASEVTGVAGTPLQPDPIRMSGASSANFSISPALPAGLLLDPDTGTLSGTPQAASAPSRYLVIAVNAFGSATTPLTLTVVAPTVPVYTSNVAMALVVGTPLWPFQFQVKALPQVQAFAVSPDLPPGLVLDSLKGTLSGTPTAPAPVATYVLSATNAVGTTELPFTLSINPTGWPLINGFTASPPNVRAGQSALLEWGVANAWQLAINGLAIDTSIYDGSYVITPLSGTTTYTLSASNSLGTATAQVAVTVLP